MFISSPQFSATTLAGEPEDKSRSLWANAWALSLTVRLAVAFSAAGQGRIPMYVTLVHLQIIELWWREEARELTSVCGCLCEGIHVFTVRYVDFGYFLFKHQWWHAPPTATCVCVCVCVFSRVRGRGVAVQLIDNWSMLLTHSVSDALIWSSDRNISFNFSGVGNGASDVCVCVCVAWIFTIYQTVYMFMCQQVDFFFFSFPFFQFSHWPSSSWRSHNSCTSRSNANSHDTHTHANTHYLICVPKNLPFSLLPLHTPCPSSPPPSLFVK